MSSSTLPSFGLASDLLAALPPPDLGDPNRLVEFVKAVAEPSARPAAQAEPTLHLVALCLGDELYAAPVDRVREIIRASGVTRVPQAPEHVRGVMSLRGAVLPVLELRTRLGLPARELGPDSRVIVAESHGRLIGLLVDSVQQVSRIRRSAIQPPPAEVRSRCSEHVVGLADLGTRMALLLDLERLLVLPASDEVSK